jgi:hypothetical protein
VKVGGENRTKLMFALVLTLVAAAALIWALTRSASPQPAAPTSAQAQTPILNPAPAPARRGKVAVAITNTIDPTLRIDLLKASEDTEYLGSGRNIFRAQAEPVKIPEPVKTPIITPPVATGPPPPPPIMLKFFGFASRSGESKKIFLSQNDDIFVAAEGDIVKGRYKILRINPSSIEVEDVLNNNRQSIPLTQS